MMRDAFKAVRAALVNSERVTQLSREVSEQSRAVRRELDTLHGDMRDLRDRVSRLEGGLAVLDRLRLPRGD